MYGVVNRLRLFRHFDPFRILVCSGDGSVGWVLSEIDRLGMHVSNALLRLCTSIFSFSNLSLDFVDFFCFIIFTSFFFNLILAARSIWMKFCFLFRNNQDLVLVCFVGIFSRQPATMGLEPFCLLFRIFLAHSLMFLRSPLFIFSQLNFSLFLSPARLHVGQVLTTAACENSFIVISVVKQF